MSFAIFVSEAARVASAPLADDRVGGQRREQVGARTKGRPMRSASLGSARLAEPVRGVQTGADGGRADASS